ncbi:Vacuolar metal resistance and drug detoxification protein [Cordyceps fumosorosea ARSEF 2679]|uniref:Vacuolar metal resistance and drug detoxification protein n=1 Tax=Cordyceps fumosorosea (strain ARSEF 2679) TaxID=1081104 RepID=A0A167WPP2_CORFA|nr:Vacuolar metal resistance and drug detoxification protein [Cordyceps fumosorosea ARSEF 2679]OAA64056.1 Vacuolar metal resistance and drug detoxification protein [Cordyceps fumosorosea ARSEF 2679]
MLDEMDTQFGPVDAGRFDFTIFFEHAMLGLVPAGIVVLALPVFLKATRASRQARPGALLWLKLILSVSLVAIQLASLILWHSATRTPVSLAASILSFVASLCVLAIIYITHIYTVQSSALLSVFLSITMLFDITMARSYYMRGGMGTIAALQVAIASLKLALAVLEEIPKRDLLCSDHIRDAAGPEQNIGFWNRSMMIWVTRLVVEGARKNLRVEDLPPIGHEYSSEQLFDRFTPFWKKAIASKKSKRPLVRAGLRTLYWELLSPVFPRLCLVGFSFGRPFLMQRVMDIISEGVVSRSQVNGLIGATILIFGGLAANLQGNFRTAPIPSKDMCMEDLAASAAVSLMTADIAGLDQLLTRLHSTWASCIELGLGIFVLYQFVGAACFLIFIPTIIASVATYYTSKKMQGARTIWNEKIQSRVASTSNILAQLKSIKAMGLTTAISNFLQGKRQSEIDTSMSERNARVFIFAIYAFGNTMAPVAVFGGARFWTRAANPMTVPEVFATYAIILIVSLPISELLGYLPYYAGGWACLVRLQKFLLLPEVSDKRDSGGLPTPRSAEYDEKSCLSVQPGPYAIEMNHVSYTSDLTGPILRDVTLRIPTGCVVMVHGGLGTGKSAFLSAVLGELPIDTGTIDIATRHVAYAAQTPWIQNLTIQDNIIGAFPFIESLYDDVIEACDLAKDLDDLADGDQTMTGSNGCNLSGGQKQRIGLARALFSRCSIIILDDVLSSLDDMTATTITERLVGRNGLLRSWNSTVIMTTKNLNILSAADMIFEVSQHGNFVQMPLPRPNFNHATTPSRLRGQTPEPADKVEEDLLDQVKGPPAVDTTKTPEVGNDNKRKESDYHLYRFFFKSTSIFMLILWFVGVAIASALERMPQIFMRIWLSIDANNNTYFAGFVALSVSDILAISIVGVQFFKQIVPQTSAALHWDLLQSTLEAKLSFLSHTDAGSLLNRFSQDVALISQTLPTLFMATVSMFFNVLVDIGVISSGAKYAAPIIVFFIVALYAIQYYYLKTSRQLRLLELETSSPLITHVTESSSGMAHIRSFGWQYYFQREFIQRLDSSQKPYYYLFCIQQWLTFVLDTMTFVSAVTLVSISLVFPQSTSDGAIGLALLNLISFSTTASLFLSVWVRVETSLGGLSRIKAFCAETPQEQDRVVLPEVGEDWPTTGKIDFNCVTASYRGPGGEVRRALNNATVSIEHGQKVSIIGRTGSGKSSMMLALLHLIEFSGSISVDNREIKTVPHNLLRSRITTLTQDGVELKGTIRFNMFPFDAPMPADDHIIAALEGVGLWAHIEKHGGLDADIVDTRLSHGHKQLLFIARAILHREIMDTKIVLVDEATSSLDAEMDQQIQELMDESFADCTVVHISHRRESYETIDLSIGLSTGEVVEVLRRSSRSGHWIPVY